MTTDRDVKPQHPGELLRDILGDRGISQAELARRADYTPKHVNSVIRGRARMTAQMAVALEDVLHVPARLWVQVQGDRDVWDAGHRC